MRRQFIKVQLILTNESQAEPLQRRTVEAELKRNGILLTSNKPDLLLVHASLLEEYINRHIPIIILERADAAVLLSRAHITRENVIGIIKNTVLSPPLLNNAVYCAGKYHTALITHAIHDAAAQQLNPAYTKIQIPELMFSKIHTGFSFGSYAHVQRYAHRAKEPGSEPRPIDISFAGTIDYGALRNITLHRKAAVNTLRKINRYRVEIAEGRKHTHAAYIDILKASKICVSPWGNGEACYRDYEAILFGCVLVKPDTSFVSCWPNIYQNNITYVPCRVDFSDLESVCAHILEHWEDYHEMRRNAYHLVRTHTTDKAIAERLAQIFYQCYDSRTSPTTP